MIRAFFFKLFSRLAPKVSFRIDRGKKVEIEKIATDLFSRHNMATLFPYLRIITADCYTRRNIHIINSSEANHIFFLLPDKRNISVRMVGNIRTTSASINKHSSLVLTEYMYQYFTRWNLAKEEDILCARAEIRHRKQSLEIARFYMPKSVFKH